jgi:hypothetical protein
MPNAYSGLTNPVRIAKDPKRCSAARLKLVMIPVDVVDMMASPWVGQLPLSVTPPPLMLHD